MEEILKIDTEEALYENDPVAKAAFENFGIKYLFPWQRLVVSNIMEAYEYQKMCAGMSPDEQALFNENNSDSFCKGRQIVLLPTGAGKSLCFQIPALLLDGPSLIIYPLLALMSDQQRRMEEGALRSVVFRGGQTLEEREENFTKIKNGAKIILANPEVLSSEELLEQLCKVGIKHIAIDEAHCVSEWGDSFRPAYLGLGHVIEKINPPMITAFTATASPVVLSRVAEILFNGESHVVRSESDRPNIHYYVRYASAKKKEALLLAYTQAHPMIIFCGTRKKAEDMSRELNCCYGSDASKFYHAGMSKDEKTFVEQWFYNSKDGILCATCAYGMGVDKKDIKTVVHLEPSATAEAYIQEAGRGGRDGSVAKAILLWSLKDSLDYSVYEKGTRQFAMRDFAETKVCRRQVLLDALGAEQAYCSGCDLCDRRREEEKVLNKVKGRKKKKFSYKFENSKENFVCDYEMAYSIIRKNKNFYDKETIEEEIYDKMNDRYRKIMGYGIWNHSDSVEVVSQLKKAGRIIDSGPLWKGKLKAVIETKSISETASNP